MRSRFLHLSAAIAALAAIPFLVNGAAASPLVARGVDLAAAPAERAEAVSGVAPILSQPSDMTLTVGETAEQTIYATDADGDPLTFSKAAGPSYMTVTTTSPGTGSATGNVHLAPGPSDAGTVSASVVVTDGFLLDQRSFQINARAINVAPVLTQPQDMTVAAGSSDSQALYAGDGNGDALDFYLASGPGYASVTTVDSGAGGAIGEFQVSPGLAISGTVTATVGVSDGVLSDEKSFSITVTRVNAAPTLAQPSNMNVRVDETKDQALAATDPNADPLTFSKVSGPAYMTVTTINAALGDGNVRLTPRSGDVGTATAIVSVTDGLLSDQKTFSITVRSNVAPYLYGLYSMVVRAGSTADQTLYAYDNDGDPLTFSKTSGPTYMTVTTTYPGAGYAYGNLHLAPMSSDSGSATGTVRVSDGMLFDEKFMSITVQPPNHPPVLSQPADMSLTAGEIGEQTVTATDPDGDYINIYKASGPSYMTVSSGYGNYGTASATIRVTPGAGDVGSAIGSITASDFTLSDTKSFTITVLAGNFPPPCSADSFSRVTMTLGSGTIEVQTADLNADGALDLVAELPNDGRVVVLLGNGDGTFGSPSNLEAGQGPASGAIADLNRDDIPDLAIVNFYSNNISVLLGDGSGAFGPKRDYAVGYVPRSVAAADVNRDGKLDLLVTNSGSNSVSVLRGAGDGTFGAATSILAGYYAWHLAVAYLNGDGAPDLVVTNSGDNDISVFLNNGTGGFGSRTDYPVGRGPLAVVARDLNGDGKADVAVGNGDSDYLSVFLGNGDGSLGPRRNFPTNDRPAQITVADLNGDGVPDLASANTGSGDVSILLGDGAGAFAPRTDVFSGYGPYGVASGDFDDDLRTDLVVANYYDGSLTLFMNSCAPRPDHPPVVRSPSKITGAEGSLITFTITANDPDGPAISSLAASFAALPPGHNATLSADAGNTGGTFTWTPTFQDARSTAYAVTFTATNVLSGSATTKITVTNVNRAPVANAGGPYSAFVGFPMTFDGTGSSDPDGDGLTFLWIFGDGATGTGANPAHIYAALGLYGVALTVSDGALTGIATTTANVVGIFQARAFTASGNRLIRLSTGKPQWCANVEPVGKSYSNVAVDLTSMVMISPGTGSVSQIRAIADKVSVGGDHDGNGVEEITACFSKDDLRQLFSYLRGNNTVMVTIEGSLFTGGIFRAQMDVGVNASGGALAASVSPNPLNPEAIMTFKTERPGSARVDLFDLQGRLVRRLIDEPALPAGYHDVRMDGRDELGERLASGVYFFRIRAAEGVETGRVSVLK